MIVAEHIFAVLLISGVITAVPIVQFFFPAATLKHLHKMSIDDPSALFFVRHWGLVVFSIAALLVYAAGHAEVRAPIMLAALIEKVGLVTMVALHWNQPYACGLRAAALFDSACVLVYALYLLGLA
ncbi:MAG: hypothetical protein SGI99_08895 [Pseudomonadota bacterium]|nr:hypothetical protein [Pseudomonadota bacterium]